MKPRDFPLSEEYIPETAERNLWFAVIERALKDYCFFFDQLTKSANGHTVDFERLNSQHRNQFTLKAIAELNRLRWFLFEKVPEPFNLEYLCQELYAHGHGVACDIRKQAAEQFKRHYNETEERGVFVAITKYIAETTKIAETQAAQTESPLRYKRYRLSN